MVLQAADGPSFTLHIVLIASCTPPPPLYKLHCLTETARLV